MVYPTLSQVIVSFLRILKPSKKISLFLTILSSRSHMTFDDVTTLKFSTKIFLHFFPLRTSFQNTFKSSGAESQWPNRQHVGFSPRRSQDRNPASLQVDLCRKVSISTLGQTCSFDLRTPKYDFARN